MKYRQICPDCNKSFEVDSIKNKISVCPECGGRQISYEKLISISENQGDSINDVESEEKKSDDNLDIMDLLNTAKESFENDIHDVEKSDEGEQKIELVVVGAYGNRGYVIPVSSFETPALIGRCGLGKEFLQEDLRVSNEHCYINYDNGDWFLTDNNSTNSTKLNNITLKPNMPTIIRGNDLIRLGRDDNTFEFEVVER